MEHRESVEMYLETIYLLESDYGHAHSVDIAKKLGVSKPSVSKAMKYLKEKKLVNKENYGSITLTNEGKKISQEIYCKHKLISEFLEHALGLSVEESAKNACRMEHIVSNQMLDAIKKYLNDAGLDASC